MLDQEIVEHGTYRTNMERKKKKEKIHPFPFNILNAIPNRTFLLYHLKPTKFVSIKKQTPKDTNIYFKFGLDPRYSHTFFCTWVNLVDHNDIFPNFN